ncbi:MAG: hypothetical protein HY291_05090 [Planctomycetes bacterium]|nr:hypothetical protein [Planctomycetota bacterium]
MTRGMEALLRNLILAAAGLLLLAGIGLAAWAFTENEEPPQSLEPKAATAGKTSPELAPANPQLDQLARAKMTRTVTPKAATTAKAAAPALDSLIRIKGIMDYGDPKSNEAIIEDVKSGRAQSYRAGDRLQGVDAVVTQVDSGVSIQYDGKTVRMEVRGNEQSEGKPMASPGSNVRTAESGELPVHP